MKLTNLAKSWIGWMTVVLYGHLQYALLRCVYKLQDLHLREKSLTSLAQNRLIIHQQCCLSEVKNNLAAKIATGCYLSRDVNDDIFALFHVTPRPA